HNNFGVTLHGLGRADAAADAFIKALTARPRYAEAFNNLGSLYKEAGRTRDAVAAFRRAIEIQPDYAVAQENLRATYGDVVPSWHFAMMNDAPRNAAYDKALRRAAAGKRVLDIGTGAGLLAMMSARAGAAEVVTCEMVDLVADHAREIIALNNLSQKIEVVGKSSKHLRIGEDMEARADVVVTETFSSGLIGEGVLPTMEHAHAELLAPGGTVIPRAASARGYLIGGRSLRDKLYVDEAAGFNLAPFAAFAPAKVGLCLDYEPHEVLSDDVELLRFDLTQTSFPASFVPVSIKVTAAGECVGVAQWLKLDLDGETSYENRPSPAAHGATWVHIVYRFATPIMVKPGEAVKVIVRHDRQQISVDLAA
ncbi:MAG: 50S ribosomal protein L11 methyltransferase, partial [Rhodospirillaceae bacterium]